MGKRYPDVKDGEWVQPIRRGYKMRCCDCSLVHTIDFRIHKGKIQLRPRRDERATAACRRKKFILIGNHKDVTKAKQKLSKGRR